MASGFTQNNRFLKLTTPLGADALLIESFTISERISDTFELEIEALAELDQQIEPKQLLGQVATVTVSLDPESDRSRHFSGVVREVHIGSEGSRFRSYRL